MPDQPVITVDFSGLGAAVGQWFTDNVGTIGNAAWAAFSAWLYAGLRQVFLDLLRASLLTVPHALTDQFAPVARLMPNTLLLAGAAAAAAMALIGLKVILQRVPAQTAFVEEVIARIAKNLALLGMLPWVISHAIDIEQQVASSIALESVDSFVSVPAGAMDFSQVIAFVIMVILGVRLWFKLASNVVHIGGAITWSPVALLAGLFPQGAAITSMWWHEFLGRLAGVCLATAAVGIGIALALGYPGLLSIAGAGGAFMAAADLVDWLARTPGQHMGGVLGVMGSGIQTGLTFARGTGPVGAAMGAAIPRNEITTRAEMFGFD